MSFFFFLRTPESFPLAKDLNSTVFAGGVVLCVTLIRMLNVAASHGLGSPAAVKGRVSWDVDIRGLRSLLESPGSLCFAQV